jgi:hypothetical protein
MGAEYIDCEWDKDASFQLDIDGFGLGALNRTYSGREDKVAAFLAGWPVGKADPIWKQFKLVKKSVTGNGALCTANLIFNGLLDGKIPPPQQRGGWARQNISLQHPSSGQTVELEYRAPTATYQYVSKTIPKKPKYEGKLINPEMPWEIRDVRGDRLTQIHECIKIGELGGKIQYTPIIASKFNYARLVMTEQFDFVQIGEYWEITETQIGVLIEPDRNDLPRWVQGLKFATAATS